VEETGSPRGEKGCQGILKMSASPTLYVDIDDTLVRWKDPIQGRLVSEWEWNDHVIEYMRRWKGRIVVWSSGGVDYASMWANRLEQKVGLAVSAVEAKWPRIPLPDDVFLDDMPMDSFKDSALHPAELLIRDM
jgi:hypothetical protein